MQILVDELPESCKTCQFQCYGECRNGCDILKTDYSMTQCHIMRGKHKDCPLIDIKTHDRELVTEVCEKIRKTIASTVDLAESNQQIKDQFHIILDLVEKEFEK